MDYHSGKIVFFDGVCGLCNKAVDWLVRHDRSHVLLFAPLQGRAASALLPQGVLSDLSTFIYAREGVLHYRSSAVIMVLNDIGGIWSAVIIFRIIPAFLRDRIYDWVSRNRYKWFGRKESCRIPTAAERLLFLD